MLGTRGHGGHRGSRPRSCALGHGRTWEKGRPCLCPHQTCPFGVPPALPTPAMHLPCGPSSTHPAPVGPELGGEQPLPHALSPLSLRPWRPPFCLPWRPGCLFSLTGVCTPVGPRVHWRASMIGVCVCVCVCTRTCAQGWRAPVGICVKVFVYTRSSVGKWGPEPSEPWHVCACACARVCASMCVCVSRGVSVPVGCMPMCVPSCGLNVWWVM